MAKVTLGRLERVDLREVWDGEASDFTPWLAQPENLKLLGEQLGLDLDLDSTEKPVGPFRADIVCKETLNDSWVLIENQLERTDHSHLGQLLTYAAGLDAVTIVWIAQRFTDEHRAALDWLNAITSEEINLFGIEMELYRIGDSAIAPQFNIVCQPNEWTRSVARDSSRGELTIRRQTRLEFWSAFREYLADRSTLIKSQKPRPQNYMVFSIGRSGFVLQGWVNTRDQWIGVNLSMTSSAAKTHLNQLQRHQQQIETAIGTPLEWYESDKFGIVRLIQTNIDPDNRDQWSAQHEWLRSKLELFYQVFRPYVQALGDVAEGRDELVVESEAG